MERQDSVFSKKFQLPIFHSHTNYGATVSLLDLQKPAPRQKNKMESSYVLLAVSPRLKPCSSKLHLPSLKCKSDHKFQRPDNLCFSDTKFKTSYLRATARSNDFRVRAAAAVPAGDSASPKDDRKMARTIKLGSMFAVWYLLNIYFNIYNKQVLKVFPHPATVSAFQFGCGTVLVLLMWSFNLHPRPNITKSQLSSLSLLALGHTTGNLLTNISLGRVAVSFTHTIKAMEPFFTVILAVLFLGARPSFWVVLSLVPIVGGVALASFTEASFNWIGFGSAMASNMTNQARNVYSKVVMVKEEETLDSINIFSILTVLSFLILAPVAILIDGVKLSPSYLNYAASQGLDLREFWMRSLLAGFCFHTYQQVSYMILQMVSPVTHSVGNSFKRVVVIVSSVIFFRTPVSPINALGTGIALAGVFLYTRAKRIKTEAKST